MTIQAQTGKPAAVAIIGSLTASSFSRMIHITWKEGGGGKDGRRRTAERGRNGRGGANARLSLIQVDGACDAS